MDTCVIANAGSGKWRGAVLVADLEGPFARHPGRFASRVVRRGAAIGGAAERVVREGFRTVAAAGGNGTINAVAGSLVGTDRRPGVLPPGTFNDVARGLGLPEISADAVHVPAEGRERLMDVGGVNGRTSLNGAGLGAHAAISHDRERVYRRWRRNRVAADLPVLPTLAGFQSPLSLDPSDDGQTRRHRTPLVSVANNAHRLDRSGPAGGGCIASRRLAIHIAPDRGRLGPMRLAAGLALRRLRAERDLDVFSGPFRFRLQRDALRVPVPADPT